MKLEKDHVLGIQSPARKSYNPFDSDDEIEAINGYAKSNVNGYDIKSFEKNADSLTFHLDSSDVSWEEAILGHSQILRRSNPADLNGEEVLSRKDTELFTDKTVNVCDLPELMVCYKEKAYHSVKDIGIDEGMPMQDKVSIDEGMPMHDKVSIKSRDVNGDINGDEHLKLSFMEGLKSRSENNIENGVSSGKWPQDSVKDNNNGDDHLKLSFMEGLKSRSENNIENDVSYGKWPQDSVKDSEQDHATLEREQIVDQCGIDDSTSLDEVKLNLSSEQSKLSMESIIDVVDTGEEAFSSRDPQLDETDDASYHKMERKEQVVSEEHGDNTFSLEKTHESSGTTSSSDIVEASTESTESVYEEATSSLSPELSSSQESSDNGLTNALSYNSKVESGSIILDFNSTTTKEKEGEEMSQHNETVSQPPEAQSMSRLDERPTTDSSTENQVHRETSFSAAVAPFASITYMGPFAHTGSISLRSESSAGSTRSFAFPVLQAEWNSSPVRMAKAEQRNRKHRGWVHSVMCCKF